jgi:hypothetical protein
VYKYKAGEAAKSKSPSHTAVTGIRDGNNVELVNSAHLPESIGIRSTVWQQVTKLGSTIVVYRLERNCDNIEEYRLFKGL